MAQVSLIPGDVIAPGTANISGLLTLGAGATGTGGLGTLTAGTGILGTAQSWTALQTFGNNISFGGATVVVTSLATNDLLQYNGTDWVNVLPSALGLVNSVTNSDGTLTISPTTGAVVASLNLAHANTWTAVQTFGNDISFGGATLSVTSLTTNDVLQYNGTNWVNVLPTALGLVNSVSNSDGTLTISPTTGAVVASLALGHANTWTGLQTFGNAISFGGATLLVTGLISGQVLQYNGTNWINATISATPLATTGATGVAVGTSATVILTHTLSTAGLTEIRVYFASTGSTTLSGTVTFTDAVAGAQTVTLASTASIVAGIYTIYSFMVNATTATAIVVSATAGAASTITGYASYFAS